MGPEIFDIQAGFCKAMGNAGRLYILHVLRDRPMSVSEICLETGLPQSNISRQLACLRAVGVVMAKRDRAGVVYQITDARIVEICDLVRSVLVRQIQNQSNIIDNSGGLSK